MLKKIWIADKKNSSAIGIHLVGGRINPQRLRLHEFAELSKRVVFDVADVLPSRFLVDGDDAAAVFAAAGANSRSVILVQSQVPEQDSSGTESRLTDEQVLRVPAEHRGEVRVPVASRAFSEVDVFVRMGGHEFGRSVLAAGVTVPSNAGDVLAADASPRMFRGYLMNQYTVIRLITYPSTLHCRSISLVNTE
jgi:hypothetical protein